VFKISVSVPGNAYVLEIEGLFTQGWRPGRTSGESVGGIFEMDSSDWSNGLRYHTFDTRSHTEFKAARLIEIHSRSALICLIGRLDSRVLLPTGAHVTQAAPPPL